MHDNNSLYADDPITIFSLKQHNTTFLVSDKPEVKYFPFSHAVRLGEIIQCRSTAIIGLITVIKYLEETSAHSATVVLALPADSTTCKSTGPYSLNHMECLQDVISLALTTKTICIYHKLNRFKLC